MSSRRTAILIGAIAIGVFAVLLIVRYVQGIQEGVDQDNEKVKVFQAQELVKRGEDGGVAIDSQKIQQIEMPQKYVPQGAIQTPDAIQKKVALFDISPGTVIVDGMFVDPATSSISFRERLKNPQHVAVSIQVDQVRGVGGFLVPGDQVNMLIYQDNTKIKEIAESAQSQKPDFLPDLNLRPLPPENLVNVGGPQYLFLNKTARYMFQKVSILAVGQNALLNPGETATTGTSGTGGSTTTQSSAQNNVGLITFNVPAKAAQWIVTGQEAGFYLTLVGKDYTPTELTPLPVVVDVLPGEDPAKLCPYKIEGGDGSCE